MLIMSIDPFHNYLHMYRRKARLSQDEIAFLLGGVSGSRISRFESGVRVPPLETALSFAILYGQPLTELFAGVANERGTLIRPKAVELLASVSLEEDGSAKKLRSDILRGILKRTES